MPRNKNIDLYKSIGIRLRNKRKELKLSQEKVAEFLNVDYVQIYKYETGETKIPIDYLLKLCGHFGTSIDYFLEGFIETPKDAKPDKDLQKVIEIVKNLHKAKQADLITSLRNFLNLIDEILRNRFKK